jgi:hypothetical protein
MIRPDKFLWWSNCEAFIPVIDVESIVTSTDLSRISGTWEITKTGARGEPVTTV